MCECVDENQFIIVYFDGYDSTDADNCVTYKTIQAVGCKMASDEIRFSLNGQEHIGK